MYHQFSLCIIAITRAGPAVDPRNMMRENNAVRPTCRRQCWILAKAPPLNSVVNKNVMEESCRLEVKRPNGTPRLLVKSYLIRWRVMFVSNIYSEASWIFAAYCRRLSTVFMYRLGAFQNTLLKLNDKIPSVIAIEGRWHGQYRTARFLVVVIATFGSSPLENELIRIGKMGWRSPYSPLAYWSLSNV
jgi:hypothetical protein